MQGIRESRVKDGTRPALRGRSTVDIMVDMIVDTVVDMYDRCYDP